MNSESILFDGRLLEMPSEAPRCGDIKVAVAYRFDVQRLVKRTLGDTVVVVLIGCPDLLGEDFLAVNAVYLIEASRDLEHAGAYTIYNDYPDTEPLWVMGITKQ